MKSKYIYLILLAVLLISTDACSKSKSPEGKKAEVVLTPVVAGQFYPGDKDILRATAEKYLNGANPAPVKGHIFGIVAPHAGYQYSGPVAANAFKAIEGKKYSTVVVMVPSHHVGFEGIAVTSADYYETPLGKIPIAKGLSQRLTGKLAWAKDFKKPFESEHSLEVELPFLQTALKNFSLLPIIIGVCNSEMLSELAGALNELLPGDDVLFVASSDLSHYHSYNEAVAKDKRTIKFIEDMDVAAFAKAEGKGEAELCGSSPVEVLMGVAKLRDGKAALIKYANSGDTFGDKSRVVGYAAMVFETVGQASRLSTAETAVPPSTGQDSLTVEKKEALLKIARGAIEAEVLGKKQPAVDVADPLLSKNGAAFVTIRKKGELRGCIGHITAVEPLYKSVRDNAIAAASRDPRFEPVAPRELKEIDIEISVLTTPQLLPNPMDVRVGTDGLIIQKGYNRGVLLPQVPTEQGWGRQEFLDGICRKAGMLGNCWKDATLYRFQAIVFHE